MCSWTPRGLCPSDRRILTNILLPPNGKKSTYLDPVTPKHQNLLKSLFPKGKTKYVALKSQTCTFKKSLGNKQSPVRHDQPCFHFTHCIWEVHMQANLGRATKDYCGVFWAHAFAGEGCEAVRGLWFSRSLFNIYLRWEKPFSLVLGNFELGKSLPSESPSRRLISLGGDRSKAGEALLKAPHLCLTPRGQKEMVKTVSEDSHMVARVPNPATQCVKKTISPN